MFFFMKLGAVELLVNLIIAGRFLAAPQATGILSHCWLARNDDGCLLPVVIDAHLRGTTVTMDISDDPENPDKRPGISRYAVNRLYFEPAGSLEMTVTVCCLLMVMRARQISGKGVSLLFG